MNSPLHHPTGPIATTLACLLLGPLGLAQSQTGQRGLTLHSVPHIQLAFGGPIGDRVERNIDNWLLAAVEANPGMLEMFRLRDRQPTPDLVPWAGEFVGKYLISAIQACRMTERPELRAHVQRTIAELISTQADDGYLGPFPRHERLLSHWDLWGHYHIMLALLMWHADTGGEEALACAVRAADLICDTYLDTDRRVLDAGSPEMNMAVIHSLGQLHLLTREDRYLRMMREIEKDWESAGDYFRTGLKGTEFFRTPKPRWESLHDLQGLVELYLITGNEDYKTAFISHWTSIAQHDRHPTGGFTTGERAVGNPYSEGAIETCCTTAWIALSVDMLRLTGNSLAADELELSTWNSVLGSQHPSGRWWTYDTPVNGVRKASAHHIVFQARHGTPELNCCSVNAPRGLGALSEWAVMVDDDGPVVNFYGPCTVALDLADGTPLTLVQETQYPAQGDVRLRVVLRQPHEFDLRLRMPAWSSESSVAANGEAVDEVEPGSYLSLRRQWRDGDTVDLRLDMSPRYWSGALGRSGRMAVYRGPVLLAFDPKHNETDTSDMPALDAGKLDSEPVTTEARFQPIVLRRFTAADGRGVTLCDFATAGAQGTDYAAWLPAVNAAPAPVWLKRPRQGERVPAGPILFQWTGFRRLQGAEESYQLRVAGEPTLSEPVVEIADLKAPGHVLAQGLPPGKGYYWSVTARNEYGSATNQWGPGQFAVDDSLEPLPSDELKLYEFGERSLMVASALDGSPEPTVGVLESATGAAPAPDRLGNADRAIALGGEMGSGLKYRLPYFPERDYTFQAWVCPEGLPTDRLHQIVSAWSTGMDDPLRVVIHGEELFARIEAGTFFSTEGVRVENGEWVHVTAVKDGPKLSLYVNGELRGAVEVPEWCATGATNIAIGANPNYTGANESFVGRIDEFAFHAEALTPEGIAGILGRQ